MNTNRNWRASLLGLGTVAALTLLATPTPAQGPGGGPPPDDMGRPPFGRPMDGQGRPPFGGPPPVSLANVPLTALAAGLNLSGGQRDSLARLKQQARVRRQDAPAPPSSASEQGVTDGIMGVLTGTQKQSVPDLLQTFRALRAAGVPLILYADLKLTPTQSGQIKALASSDAAPSMGREVRQKVTALLTDTQKEMVEESREEARTMGGPPPGGRFMRQGQGRGPGNGWGQGRPNDRRGGPPPGGPGDDGPGGPPRDGGGPDGPMGGPPPGGPQPDAF